MKRFFVLFYLLFSVSILSQIQDNVTWSVEPNPFNDSEKIKITVSGVDPSKWSTQDVYLWTWFFDSNDVEVSSQINWNGEWNNSKESMKMTKNSDGTFSFEFTPTELFQYNGIGKIGVLAKAKNGTGDKKTPDYFFEVGRFDLTINSPKTNPVILEREGLINISVSSANEINYFLINDDKVLFESLNNKNFSKDILGPDSQNNGLKLSESTTLRLLCEDVNDSDNFINLNFEIVVEPVSIEIEPPFELKDGINYDNNNSSIIYLQLNAPNKDFVYVLGNFNQYENNNESLMNINPSNNKFWIEIGSLSFSGIQLVISSFLILKDFFNTD